MSGSDDERADHVARREQARHATQIEGPLAMVPEVGRDAVPVPRALVERLLILEGQINYQARMSRLTAIFLSTILAVVLALGGLVIWTLGMKIERLIDQRVDDARKLGQALQLLTGMNERMAVGEGRTSLTEQEISDMRGLVGDILGNDANGFLRNLSIQNELLDELSGTKPRRRAEGDGR